MSMTEIRSPPLATIVEVISAAIGVGFVVSLIYDWGYGFALGLDFSQLPSTVTDHFRTGILWFPPLLAAALFWVAVEYQIQLLEKGLTEDEIVETAKNPKKLKKFRDGPYKLLPWIMLLGCANFLLIGDAASAALPVGLSVLWLKFAEWCNSAPLIRQRRAVELKVAFTLIPVAVICAFFFGYNSAVTAAFKEPKVVEIELDSKRLLADLKLLRVFEAGFLVLNSESYISFIPFDHVVEVRQKQKYMPYRGFLCEYFEVVCDDLESMSEKAEPPVRSD